MTHRVVTGISPSRLAFRWETNDRHPTMTSLVVIGIPLLMLLAVVGLPPVDIHGPLHYLGIMGPTCGMTRGGSTGAIEIEVFAAP